MTKKLVIFLLVAITLSAQPVLEKVELLNLEKYNEGIQCYYSIGFGNRAQQITELLTNSANYFEKTFNVQETFAIAVLNSKHWNEITNIPYGLPFVSGPPFIVCFPSDINNELGHLVKEVIINSSLPQKYNMSIDDLTLQFISLIGFHELGHIYSKSVGIQFPNKWTFEFAATYFAYLYLNETAPDKNKLWLDVGRLLLDNIKPKYTSLKDFEELYVRVGVENYAWYQVVFLERVAETAFIMKEHFLKQIMEIKLSEKNYSLDELEQIDKGFLKWANNYGLLNE